MPVPEPHDTVDERPVRLPRPVRTVLSVARRWYHDAPASRLEHFLRWGIGATALLIALLWGRPHFGALFDPPPRPAVLDQQPDDTRYGLPLSKRMEVFRFMATRDPGAVRAGKRKFPKHAWSQQDHRANVERHNAKSAAKHFGISRSLVYAVMQEGIRRKWTAGKRGKPLDASIVPLDPRR